jgi:3-oxoacyl-[acyl-carrier protein] reductase
MRRFEAARHLQTRIGPFRGVLGKICVFRLAGRALTNVGARATLRQMDLQLRGRRVLITGGSRGIGLAIALALVDEGARVTICARGQEDLARAAEELACHGTTPHTVVADVTDSQSLGAAVAEAAETFGGLDLVVANAGGSTGGDLLHSTAEDWMQTFRANVLHAATTVRAAVPHLEHTEDAAVVIVASISGWKPRTKSSYSAAKAAEIHLAPALAAELGPLGIRVNALSPGAVVTAGGRWERTREADPDAFDEFVRDNAPRGRLVTVEEVADVACFLLSARANGINGAHVRVDGGQDRSTDRRPYP